MAAVLAACGGGSSPANPATNTASAGPAGTVTADGLVPNLDDLGYKLTQQGKEPAALANLDSALALYQKQGTSKSIQLRVYVFPDEASAEKQWSAYAEAFRHPPPEVLGTASKNIDTTGPQVGQLQKSYVTDKADASGNLVWTDIYRLGRTVWFSQVLDSASGDGMAIRRAVADRVAAKAK